MDVWLRLSSEMHSYWFERIELRSIPLEPIKSCEVTGYSPGSQLPFHSGQRVRIVIRTAKAGTRVVPLPPRGHGLKTLRGTKSTLKE